MLDQFAASLERARPAQALVLGHVPGVARLLPPHGLRQRLHLPGLGLVQLGGARAGRSGPGCARSTRGPGRSIDPVWEQITDRWQQADPGNDFAVHGTAIVGFCNLCQLVLCDGTPAAQRGHGDRTGRPAPHLLLRALPLDLRAAARALRRATRTWSSACWRARRRPTWSRCCSATSASTTTAGARTPTGGDYPFIRRTRAERRTAMIPLYGFLQGDTLGLLVLARPEDTAADLCAQAAVGGLGAGARRWRRPVVVYKGQALAPEITVRTAQHGAARPLRRGGRGRELRAGLSRWTSCGRARCGAIDPAGGQRGGADQRRRPGVARSPIAARTRASRSARAGCGTASSPAAAHEWQYDARTGRRASTPAARRCRRFPVEIRDGEIWVDVDVPPRHSQTR